LVLARKPGQIFSCGLGDEQSPVHGEAGPELRTHRA
jgi:hypothetical protein